MQLMSNVSRHQMSDLQSLAHQKSAANLQRRIDALPAAIQALQRKLAPQGLGLSGNMLQQVEELCSASIREYGDTLNTDGPYLKLYSYRSRG